MRSGTDVSWATTMTRVTTNDRAIERPRLASVSALVSASHSTATGCSGWPSAT